MAQQSRLSRKMMMAAYRPSEYWIQIVGGNGSDIGNAAAVDSQGNIVITGSTSSDGVGGNDAYIAKFDTLGEILWDKTLGGTGTDICTGIAVDSSDNIIVTGYTTSVGAGNEDMLLAKYNSSGTLLWRRTLGGTDLDRGLDVAVDSSDNIIVAGFTLSDGAGQQDGLLAKYNSSGTLLWDKTLGGTSRDEFNGVAVDGSNNIIACGFTRSEGLGTSAALVVKYNSSGTVVWQKLLSQTGLELFHDVAIDSSNNIIVVGYTTSDGAGGYDCLIAKYNSSGTLLWDRTLGGTLTDVSEGVTVDSANNIIITGYYTGSSADILIAKYNSSGTLQWDKLLRGSFSDFGRGVAVDSDDNVIFVGYGNSFDFLGNSIVVAKLPPDGSGDGTYNNITYEDATLTDEAAVLTDASGTLTNADAVLTDSSPFLSSLDAVLSSNIYIV